MKKFLLFLSVMFFAIPVMACTSSEIDVLGDGTQCETVNFSIGTTNSTSTIKFIMTAIGTFYVDCGNGGTLNSDANDVTNNNTITRSNTTEVTYTCTWGATGTQTIRFAGTATGYSTSPTSPAIAFYISSGGTQANIASVSGNLSAMFPKLNTSATGAQPKFCHTFHGAANLTSVPNTLFANYTTGANYMFSQTFQGTGLTSIPENLFANLTTGGNYIFSGTFLGCTGLTSIPDGLFFSNATSVNGASYMFRETFRGCTSLTSMSENLFAKITTGADNMFYATFTNCTKLGGYIPPSTFAGLIANNHPTTTNMWSLTFADTKLVTSCPTGTTQYITGYEGSGASTWNGKVSCEEIILDCSSGYYLPANIDECIQCPANSYCVGGTYNFNETTDQGIQSCVNSFAPVGSAVCYPHIMHVGNDIMYLKSTSRTIPSLNVQIGNEIFYANMKTTQTYMSSDSPHYFRIQSGNNNYWVCDDTTCPELIK